MLSVKAALRAVLVGTASVGPGMVVAGTVRVTWGPTITGVALSFPPRIGSRFPWHPTAKAATRRAMDHTMILG
jgi:hypothetical protein